MHLPERNPLYNPLLQYIKNRVYRRFNFTRSTFYTQPVFKDKENKFCISILLGSSSVKLKTFIRVGTVYEEIKCAKYIFSQVLARELPFVNSDGGNYQPPFNMESGKFEDILCCCRHHGLSLNNTTYHFHRIMTFDNMVTAAKT